MKTPNNSSFLFY